MSMEAIASPARLTPFEQLRYARQVIQTESRALALVAKRLDGEFCRAVELPVSMPGQRDRLRHGQGGPDRSEDHGHAGLDGHAEPLSAPGRGVARRPWPHPARRRGAGPFAERRDRGGAAAAAAAGRTWACRSSPSPPGPTARWAGPPRWCWNWARWKRHVRSAWPPAAARRRCWPWATPWRWSPAGCGTSAARISPAFTPPEAWARSSAKWSITCGRWRNAAWPPTARRSARCWSAWACPGGGPGPRCWWMGRANFPASSPTATWPGCSSSAATASSTARSAT